METISSFSPSPNVNVLGVVNLFAVTAFGTVVIFSVDTAVTNPFLLIVTTGTVVLSPNCPPASSLSSPTCGTPVLVLTVARVAPELTFS